MMRSIRFNAILKILLSIFNILIPLFVGPYIIRMLSRTSYDTYTKASAEITLFLTLAGVGIYTYGIRSVSKVRKNPEETKSLFTELFLLGLMLNVLFALIYGGYILFVNNHRGEVIYWILMAQFVGSTLSSEWMNEGMENYRFITLKSMIVKGVYVAAIFMLIRRDDLTLYGWIVSLTYALESLAGFLYIVLHYRIRLQKLHLKRHFKPLFYIFLISNISLLYVQADKIMLGLLISDSAVSTYTIPNYIVTSVYNVVVSLLIVAIPRLNHLLCNHEEEKYRTLYKELIRAFYMVFVPILFYVFANAKTIMIVYGAGKYNDCILPLQLFAITILFNSAVYVQREGVLYLYEKEKQIIVLNLIGGVITFGSNWILYFLGLFSPLSAIISLSIAYLCAAVLMQIYIYRNIGAGFRLFTGRTISYILFSLPVLPIAYFVNALISDSILRLVLSLVISVVLYTVMLLASKDEVFVTNLKYTFRKIRELGR